MHIGILIFSLQCACLMLLDCYVSGRFIEASLNVVSCACNTQECRSQGTNRCMATNMCYVQYVPPTGKQRIRNGQRGRRDNYIRGCINRSTPLLCENRPPALPGHLQSEWPVLHCCSSDMCNRNVSPTLPNWMPTSTPMIAQTQEKDKQAAKDMISGQGAGEDQTQLAEDLFEQNEDTGLAALSAADPAEVPLDESSPSTANEIALTRRTISDRIRIQPSDGAGQTDKNDNDVDDKMQTRILIPQYPAVVTSTTSDGIFSTVSSTMLYIGVPVISVVVLIALIVLGVLALRRSQYVSTENLVIPGSKSHLHVPVGRQSLKKKPSSPTGHDHVSYISGSSLDRTSYDSFHHYPSYFAYQSSMLKT